MIRRFYLGLHDQLISPFVLGFKQRIVRGIKDLLGIVIIPLGIRQSKTYRHLPIELFRGSLGFPGHGDLIIGDRFTK